jgi:hypothetical protein
MIQIPARAPRRPHVERRAERPLLVEPFAGLTGPVLWAQRGHEPTVHAYRVSADAIGRPITLCRQLWPAAVADFERHVLYEEPDPRSLCAECIAADQSNPQDGAPMTDPR